MKRKHNDIYMLDTNYLDYIFQRIEEDNSMSELDFDTDRTSITDIRHALNTLRSNR